LRYRPEIDGLRAIAVISVILFHAGFETFSGGLIGVDVFFVISGYLISSIMLSEMDEKKFNLINFYVRRMRRILPALFFIMALCIPFAWIWLVPSNMKDFSQSLIAVPTFSSNILFWSETGYFHPTAQYKPLLHTWSLAVEEQYYILFPLFLMLAWQFGKRWILATLIVVALLSLGVAHWASYNMPVAAFYLLPTRGWEILLGVFVAFYFNRHKSVHFRQATNQVLSAVGFTLILFSIFAYNEQTPFPSLFTLVPTIGAVLVILFTHKNTFVHRLLSHSLMVGMGLASYSAYLWHQPLLAYAKNLTMRQLSFSLSGIFLVLIVPLSYLTWRYVEKPFRNGGNFSTQTILSLSLFGTLIFIILGMAGNLNNGYKNRFVLDEIEGWQSHKEYHKYIDDNYFICSPNEIAKEALTWFVVDEDTGEPNEIVRCNQSKKDTTIDIALVGDSHAEHLFLGLAEALTDKNVVYYSQGGTTPTFDNPKYKKIFKHLLASDTIGTVIFGMVIQGSLGSSRDKNIENKILNTVNMLIASGKDVYFADDVPIFPFGVERCQWTKWPFIKKCDTDKEFIDSTQGFYLRSLEHVKQSAPRLRLIHLKEHLCDEQTCSMVHNGLLMYRDHNHLSIYGSKYIGAQIVAEYPELRD